jgi:hypothetical protein
LIFWCYFTFFSTQSYYLKAFKSFDISRKSILLVQFFHCYYYSKQTLLWLSPTSLVKKIFKIAVTTGTETRLVKSCTIIISLVDIMVILAIMVIIVIMVDLISEYFTVISFFILYSLLWVMLYLGDFIIYIHLYT